MRNYLMSLVFMAVITPIVAQNDTTKTHTSPTDSIIYACAMHPEVITSKAGKCPKCGMDLVQTTSSSSEHKMNMMMCPIHGMVNMDHKHDKERDNKKMMKVMGIAMGAMMVVMIVIIGNH